MTSSRIFRLTPSADRDLERIREYTLQNHGRKTADAYNALIAQAFKDITSDPYRPSSKERSDLADGIRSYHIDLSKARVASTVKSPRHMVFYFTPDEDRLVVSRVLHDAQDYTRTMSEMRDHVMEHAATPSKPHIKNKTRER